MKRNYIQEYEYRIAALLRATFESPGSEEHRNALESYKEIKQIDPDAWALMRSSEGESSASLE
jgi:hypothetical protein